MDIPPHAVRTASTRGAQDHHDKLSILELGTMDTKGGAAAVSWGLKQGLETRGHRVNMVVGYKRSQDPAVREIWDAPLNNFISSLIKRNFRARLHHHLAYWMANDIAFLPGKRIDMFPEFKNADLIHAHNLHTLFFNLKALPSLSRQKPFIWTLHDMWPILGDDAYSYECAHWTAGGCQCATPRTLPRLRWNNTRHLWSLKKKIYSRARLHLVTPSRWLADCAGKSMLKDHPCTVIYNGIDERVFAPGDKRELRAKLNLPHGKTIVLFAGKGGKDNVRKGWAYAERVIAAARGRNDILFLCLGGYDAVRLAQENVSFIPYIADPTAFAQYYAASDLLLYPSLADNCPLVILEAMACGLPVLAFRTGGIPELVPHQKNGYIARYKDGDDFQDGFDWFMGLAPSMRTALSAASRARILKSFTLNRMVDNYLALYYKILGMHTNNKDV